jgi:hypothetical protein
MTLDLEGWKNTLYQIEKRRKVTIWKQESGTNKIQLIEESII